MLITADHLTLQSLNLPVTRKNLDDTIKEIQEYSQTGDANELYLKLRKILASPELATSPELKEEFEPVLTHLGFLSLPLRAEEEVVSLLQKHIVFALDHGIDVQGLLEQFLDLYHDTLLDNRLRRKVLEAISHGEESIGSQPINREGPKLSPTITHWIQDLLVTYRLNQVMGGLEELEYLGKQKQLDAKSRKLLQDVFRIYNSLRFPRFREQVREGESIVERTAPAAVPTVIPERPATRVPDGTLAGLIEDGKRLMKPSFERESSLRQKLGDDPVKIKKELVDALKMRDTVRVAACLLILARTGRLHDALKQSESWRNTVVAYINQKYPDVDLRMFIERKPASSQVISEFLQYLLQDRLGMPEEDAAIVGMELGDIMDAEYRLMAYADESAGRFRWMGHEVKDGELVDTI